MKCDARIEFGHISFFFLAFPHVKLYVCWLTLFIFQGNWQRKAYSWNRWHISNLGFFTLQPVFVKGVGWELPEMVACASWFLLLLLSIGSRLLPLHVSLQGIKDHPHIHLWKIQALCQNVAGFWDRTCIVRICSTLESFLRHFLRSSHLLLSSVRSHLTLSWSFPSYYHLNVIDIRWAFSGFSISINSKPEAGLKSDNKWVGEQQLKTKFGLSII